MSAAGARLVLRGNAGLHAEWELVEQSSLGRAPGNQVVLNDREVSKEHAVLRLEEGDWVLRDLSSANGTFVNGRRVTELKLRDGDEVLVGATRLLFRIGGQATPAVARTNVTMVASEPALIASAAVDEDQAFRPAGAVHDVEQLRRDYEKLRIAHEFHRAMGAVRDPRLICQKVLDVAMDMLPADSGVVLLRDAGAGGLKVAAVKAPKDETGVLLSETLLDKVVQTRQGVLTADAMIDSRFSSAQSIVSRGVRSAMAVPLIAPGTSTGRVSKVGLAVGEVRGVLFLDTRAQTNAFGEKDLKLLTAIGVQAGVALENAELAEARDQLSRYLPPPLVEQAARGAIAIEKQGRQVEGTILFADLRNFTSLSEKQSAGETVALLNRFFELMVEEVFAAGGVLDKFLGDGLMAMFGLPVAREDAGAVPALKCALAMQERMDQLNKERADRGAVALAMGVGVNTGTVIVGSMGSERRSEYTAIGDPVNLASRLCGVAAGGEVLCGEVTAERAKGQFRLDAMPAQRVKGKERPVPVFRVLGSSG